MHEIRWRLSKIIDRQNRDLEVNAKLHGLEIQVPKARRSLSKEQKKAMADALEKAKERKASEYGKR